MKKTIFLLVKIFDNESYAKDFLDGKLFANSLSFFKKIEEDEEANRVDKHEGVTGWYQPKETQLIVNGKNLTGGLAGPVSIQMHRHNYLNIFCTHAIHSGDFGCVTNKNLFAFNKQLEVSNECLKLGNYAVVVTNVTQFIERVKSTVTENNFGLQAGLVDYYDPESFNGSFSEEKVVFQKRKEYKHQREYRFAIDSCSDNEKPIYLNIGDINDIAMFCNTCDIKNLLKAELSS